MECSPFNNKVSSTLMLNVLVIPPLCPFTIPIKLDYRSSHQTTLDHIHFICIALLKDFQSEIGNLDESMSFSQLEQQPYFNICPQKLIKYIFQLWSFSLRRISLPKCSLLVFSNVVILHKHLCFFFSFSYVNKTSENFVNC